MMSDDLTNGISAERARKARADAIRHYRSGDLRVAFREAAIAAEASTADTVICNLAGAIALEIGEPVKALKYLLKSIDANSDQADAQYLIGNAYLRTGHADRAIIAFRNSTILNPGHPDAYANLGIALRETGKYQDAERSLRKALAINPDHPEANNGLAGIFDLQGRHKDAEPYARRAVTASPGTTEYIVQLATILRNDRRYADSQNAYEQALQRSPDNPRLLYELGSVLREQNLFEEAKTHYARAMKLAPRSTDVLRNSADFFRSIRKNEEAADAYHQLIEITDSPDSSLYNNYAITLRDLDRFDEAEQMYMKSVELAPENAAGYNNLAILSMEMGKADESIELYAKAIELDPNYGSARSNMLFFMNYSERFSPEDLFAAHLEWQKYHAEPVVAGSDYHGNSSDPGRKLRIGYLSADLYGHAVSYFIDAALKYHDRENFEVYCYAHVLTPDDITKRLTSFVSKFRYIHQLNAREVAHLIREDEIDILIELGGHTAGNRLDVVALRPAPVQVTWIGYPNTTGLDCVDYRFVDEITDPVGRADETHTEQLWRLPRSFTCYTPTGLNLAESKTPPSEEDGYITFGSFNNSSKLSASTIKTWAKILERVPTAKLLLKSASFSDDDTKERFRKRFMDLGVEPERIELFGRLRTEDHLLLYNKIDIALDPFPYNGTTTSCEAIMMGVPIVTLAGDRHAARVTASILHQVDLDNLVGSDEDDYVKRAVNLANDPERLSAIRRSLRDTMLASALCDGPGHTKEIETAYREMWQRWCDKADERADERRRRGWPLEAPNKPSIAVMNCFAGTSIGPLSKSLSVMQNLDLLTDVHPAGTHMFPLFEQAANWLKLYSKEEEELFTSRKLQAEDAIIDIYNRSSARGSHLVLRIWSHLDFIGVPFLGGPSSRLLMSERLAPFFDVTDVFITRHPLGMWSDYARHTTVSDQIDLEDFMRGYKNYAEHASRGSFLRLEDLHKDPAAFLQTLCEMMKVPFDPTFEERWFLTMKVTGETLDKQLALRFFEDFEEPEPAYLHADLAAMIKSLPGYSEATRMLGYDEDYPLYELKPSDLADAP